MKRPVRKRISWLIVRMLDARWGSWETLEDFGRERDARLALEAWKRGARSDERYAVAREVVEIWS